MPAKWSGPLLCRLSSSSPFTPTDRTRRSSAQRSVISLLGSYSLAGAIKRPPTITVDLHAAIVIGDQIGVDPRPRAPRIRITPVELNKEVPRFGEWSYTLWAGQQALFIVAQDCGEVAWTEWFWPPSVQEEEEELQVNLGVPPKRKLEAASPSSGPGRRR
ncbi:hypothetical protein FA13DRAFT_1719068 [Coprinellus micaceus]|uniref:Uncharacterized protein n=1 Tax=Coprinellus micaceus TaxID=71717 RepID=A0A4Y7SC29_COPMI|nr:hypothetical protein FA13DRAFT_1719068 [Coprinellus micaceus]